MRKPRSFRGFVFLKSSAHKGTKKNYPRIARMNTNHRTTSYTWSKHRSDLHFVSVVIRRIRLIRVLLLNAKGGLPSAPTLIRSIRVIRGLLL
jgi:hypothetical protein